MASSDLPLDHPPFSGAVRLAGKLLARGVDLILPHRCAGCGMIAGQDAGWCPDCWKTLDFIAGPGCARCDRPLPAAAGPEALCLACIADPPPYSRVRAPLAYGVATRRLVLRFKYGRRVGSARLIARMIVAILPPPEDSAAAPLLVPVPLHRFRLWSRGFNQSAVIATHIAHRTGMAVEVMALRRTRATAPLRGLGRNARARTVRGAFAVDETARSRISGRTIWLVDDIFTTGATAAACTRALLRAGAERVEVIAFARVIDNADRVDVDSAPAVSDM